jgi:hypothetical protein
MKAYITAAAIGMTILANAPAFAGGPIIEETEVAADRDNRVPTWVMIALGIAVIAALSGGSDVCYVEDVPVEPEQPSGGC